MKDIIKPGPVLKEELTRLNTVYDELLAGFDQNLGGQEKLNREVGQFFDLILLLHASYAQAETGVLIEESISNSNNIEDINSMIPGQSMVKSQISQHTLLSKATLQQITEKFDSLKNEIGKQIGYDQATKENHEVLLAMITIRMIPYINSIVKNNFDQCSFAPYKRHDCGWDGISKSECEVRRFTGV